VNARTYSGWRGVTDHLHILVAVSYEPIEGHLCCRFKTGDPVIFSGVPEAKYQTLIHSPFAGSYFRKYIRGAYPCPFESELSPYQPKEKVTPKNLKPVEYPNPQRDLFGTVIHG
jgi:hypothetical protein